MGISEKRDVCAIWPDRLDRRRAAVWSFKDISGLIAKDSEQRVGERSECEKRGDGRRVDLMTISGKPDGGEDERLGVKTCSREIQTPHV